MALYLLGSYRQRTRTDTRERACEVVNDAPHRFESRSWLRQRGIQVKPSVDFELKSMNTACRSSVSFEDVTTGIGLVIGDPQSVLRKARAGCRHQTPITTAPVQIADDDIATMRRDQRRHRMQVDEDGITMLCSCAGEQAFDGGVIGPVNCRQPYGENRRVGRGEPKIADTMQTVGNDAQPTACPPCRPCAVALVQHEVGFGAVEVDHQARCSCHDRAVPVALETFDQQIRQSVLECARLPKFDREQLADIRRIVAPGVRYRNDDGSEVSGFGSVERRAHADSRIGSCRRMHWKMLTGARIHA